MNNLRDVLVDNVRDLYDAEKQLTKALPKMVKGADSPELRSAFQDHLRQTEGHVSRLESVFKELDTPARSKPCVAMKGLVDEGAEVLAENEAGGPATDAALIVAAQKIEHYEIGAYGSARAFAETLGLSSVASTLQETLDEEGAADKKLTEIAESGINAAAANGPTDGMSNGRRGEQLARRKSA